MRWRTIELTRGVAGAALVVAPGAMLRNVLRTGDDTTSVFVARVLGARQVAQAALSGMEPSPEVLAMGVWVDLAHAATATGLAAVDHTRAVAGAVNAVTALGWAGWGYADLRSGPVTAPAHDRRRDLLARRVLRLLPGGQALADTVSRRRQSSS